MPENAQRPERSGDGQDLEQEQAPVEPVERAVVGEPAEPVLECSDEDGKEGHRDEREQAGEQRPLSEPEGECAGNGADQH